MPKGSIPGERRGGRQQGTPNRATAATAAAIAASGLTPLDFLLSVMRDETAPRAERMEAAAKAAPYVHARLAAIEHTPWPRAAKGVAAQKFRRHISILRTARLCTMTSQHVVGRPFPKGLAKGSQGCCGAEISSPYFDTENSAAVHHDLLTCRWSTLPKGRLAQSRRQTAQF